MPRVLIVGSDGLIGASLATYFGELGWVVKRTSRRPAKPEVIFLDLAVSDPAMDNLPEVEFAVLCAAMTRFSDCREAPDVARRVNAENPIRLAEHLAARGTRTVLLSTSAVFDGSRPFISGQEPTCPTSIYGRLKAEAERGVLAPKLGGGVVRLTKVLSQSNALIGGWVGALRRGETVEAFQDLRLAPIGLLDVAVGVKASAENEAIIQVSGANDISYFDVLAHLTIRLGLPFSRARPITSADRGIPPEDRALHATLDTTALSAHTPWLPPAPLQLIDALFISPMLGSNN